jgi:hypothetical protein
VVPVERFPAKHLIRCNLAARLRTQVNGRGIAHLPRSPVNAENLKRWTRVVLVIAAILATALSWSGLSIGELVSALSRR